MRKIYRDWDEVWDYYIELKVQLKESALMIVAEDEEYGVEIALDYTRGYEPVIDVFIDDRTIEECKVTSEEECEEICKAYYDTYLCGDIGTIYEAMMNAESEPKSYDSVYADVTNNDFDDEEGALMAIEYEINKRNDELRDAAQLFLDTVLDDCKGDIDEKGKGLMYDIIDVVGNYLYESRGISIYWPGFTKGDDPSTDAYTEYPYDE